MKKIKQILLTLCLLLMCSSCASSEEKKQETTKQSDILDAQKTLDALIKVDESNVSTDAADICTGADIAELILSKAQIEVLEIEKDKWNVRISAPDMKELVEKARKKTSLYGMGSRIEVYQTAMDEMTEKLTRMISNGEYKLIKNELSLKIIKGEPVLDETAVDALYGGLIGVYKDLLLEYQEVMSSEN